MSAPFVLLHPLLPFVLTLFCSALFRSTMFFAVLGAFWCFVPWFLVLGRDFFRAFGLVRRMVRAVFMCCCCCWPCQRCAYWQHCDSVHVLPCVCAWCVWWRCQSDRRLEAQLMQANRADADLSHLIPEGADIQTVDTSAMQTMWDPIAYRARAEREKKADVRAAVVCVCVCVCVCARAPGW